MSLTAWPEDEREFKGWLREHAVEALTSVGVQEGQRVLDYGCNSGTYAIPAAGLVGARGRVLALDINTQALNALRHKACEAGLEQIEVIQVDAQGDALARIKTPVDVVLLIDMLQAIDDPAALLLKLHHVLKPGGVLAVFPMHLGVSRARELCAQDGLYELQEQWGMLLCFRRV